MKICFLTCNPFGFGGVQRVLSIIAGGLAAQHEVTVLHENDKKPGDTLEYPYPASVCFLSGGSYFDVKGRFLFRKVIRRINEKVVSLPPRVLRWIYYPASVQQGLIDCINRNEFDLVFAAGPKDTILLCLIKDQVKAKCIGWEHNTHTAYFSTRGAYVWRQKKLFKAVAPNLDGYITLTKADSAIYRQMYGVDAVELYNPISFTAEPGAHGRPGEILFVGRLEYRQKGLDYLAAILYELSKMTENFHVTVVGEGSGRQAFTQDLARYGVAGKVDFAGYRSDVAAFYRTAAVLVLPSRWEGFGLVVTEAMEYAVPVISFRTTGPAEIITDQLDGILIDRYDIVAFARQLYAVLSDRQMRDRLAENAKKNVARFHRDAILAQWNAYISDRGAS